MSFLGTLALLALGAGATKVGYDKVTDYVSVQKSQTPRKKSEADL